MGMAKRAWLEEQERGYSSNEGVTVCSDCFSEAGIKQFIEENAFCGKCSYCESDDVKACALDSVIDHILSSIRHEWGHPADEGLPYESREGGWQVAEVIDTWELLDNLDVGTENVSIYEDICRSIHDMEWCEKDPYSLSTDRTLMYGWEGFCDFVKNRVRYLFFRANNPGYNKGQHDEMNPVEILDALGGIVMNLGLIKQISVNTDIKRVRIVNQNVFLNSAKDLGSPPREFSNVANRMSPSGIPMFYGAFDIETAVSETYEIRPGQNKKAICGSFRPVRDLSVIDLSEELHVPSLFDEHERKNRSNIRFLKDFISDFTKPIERVNRAHIDYVPTQIVTEYFRHVFGEHDGFCIDGVIYPSSKNQGHKAIVIFADSEQCADRDNISVENHLLALHSVENIALT